MGTPLVRRHLGSLVAVAAMLVVASAETTFAQAPLKWSAGPKPNPDYQAGGNPSVPHGSDGAGYLRSAAPAPKDFATLATSLPPGDFAGKRVRLSAYVKTDNVEKLALVWLRVDGASDETLAVDNMENRPIKGTSGWRKYDLVVDVPAESARLMFGLLLEGPGQVWIDGVTLESVGPEVPTTALPPWNPSGVNPGDYETGGNPLAPHEAAAAGYIRSKVPEPRSFGTMGTGIPANRFRGQRLRFSAWVRTEDVGRYAGLWMRVDGPDKALEFDNMSNRPITGTRPWAKYDVVLDVPSSAVAIYYGLILEGRGRAWIDGATLAPVGTDTPVTKIVSPFEEFYAGNFATVAKAMPEWIARLPTSFTRRLMLYLSLHRSGQTVEARAYLNDLAAGLADRNWAAPVVLFYAGRLSEADVLAAAVDADATIDKERKCEAYYYLGLAYLLNLGGVAGDEPTRMVKAREYFEQSIATGVTNFVEYRASQAELGRMKK